MRRALVCLSLSVLLAPAPVTALVKVLKDVNPGGADSDPRDFGVLGTRAFFSAVTSAAGRELWVTDGTANGTQLVLDIAPGAESSNPNSPTAAGGFLYFVATEPASGEELWRTDGTAPNTVRVADLRTGALGSGPRGLSAMGDRVLFVATTDAGAHAFAVGGTPPLVEDLGAAQSVAVLSASMALLFNGTALQVTDGTAAGTTALPALGGTPARVGVAGGWAYFFLGAELWRADGTAGGAVLVRSLGSGFYPLSAPVPVRYGVVFLGSASGQVVVWNTDGTSTGTVALRNIGSVTGDPVLAGGLLFWSGWESGSGYELWATDGTVGGSGLVRDIELGSNSSSPQVLTAVGTKLFFRAYHSSYGHEPFESDGTANGTHVVADVYGGMWDDTYPTEFGGAPGYMLFNGRTLYTYIGREPWIFTPCGNGIVDPGEDCEPGTAPVDPCCSAECRWAAAGTPCADDGVFCTGPEQCDGAGACLSTGDPCPDLPCQHCNPATGTCADAAGTPCGDQSNSPCDAPDACNGMGDCSAMHQPPSHACRPAASSCDVAERCDGQGGPCPADVKKDDGEPCADSLVCNGAEVCAQGSCTVPGPLDCDDDNLCTTDTCTEPNGCRHDGVPGCCLLAAQCNDGNPCTTDACVNNLCQRTPDATCGADGGASSSGGSSTSGGSGVGGSSGGSGGGSGGGCACSGSSDAAAAAVWFALGAAALLGTRRRR